MAALSLALGGCAIGALIGGMAESYRETSTRAVAAEYLGVEGKSFAVIVYTDRLIQADQPRLVAKMTNAMANRLAQNANAGGYVPGPLVLDYQFNNPNWAAFSYEDLAEEFGVDRLVIVEIYEYRLHEPGNSYTWDGFAAALVGVFEADGVIENDFSFSREVAVGFPDDGGYGPTDFGADVVAANLNSRLLDRASWLFYEHQEPYYPDY